ncbi:MAG: ATP-binding cassette domain-containing protein [Lachnospiraceae bacterium]|nr:ATP-binding cassette domain-containing protein [Lachnospiraceae bacterium]
MEILTIKELTFTYPESETPAVEQVSLSVQAGDFFVLCGQSGCGKSTLLRNLKPRLTPHGIKRGTILFEGRNLDSLSDKEGASDIGFVFQSPDNQIVTDKVWHELAFGLESLGYETPVIRRKVAEMASFFGIQNWFYKNVTELSGGQKQLLNLAAVMVMQPKLLILDEPTSQLDPIAASDFLAVLKRINRELGTTMILTEHRLEEALPLASGAAVMERGRLICRGSVAEIGACLKKENHAMFLAMPAAMRIWGSVDSASPCPVSVREGREFLSAYAAEHDTVPLQKQSPGRRDGSPNIVVSDAWFRYEKELPDIVKGVNLTVRSGELLCILGGNGTGKTTTLKLLSGRKTPWRGEVKTKGRIGFLPQNPQTLFVKKTVYEDLKNALVGLHAAKENQEERMEHVLTLCHLHGFENRHPYDLSGGEQQRVALAKLLLINPDILLLDEPTKGLDAQFQREFADILKRLAKAGVCIVMVSHDIEFCAQYADRCALFFDGSIVTEGIPAEFFSGNNFYTTAANRIAREVVRNAVTTDDVIYAIGGTSAKTECYKNVEYKREEVVETQNITAKKLPIWRKIGAILCGLLSFLIFIYTIKTENLSDRIGPSGLTSSGEERIYLYGVLLVFLMLTALLAGRRSETSIIIQLPTEQRKLSKRTWTAVFLIILCIPFTLLIGIVYVGQKQYYLTALAVLVECMLPFFMVFEGRKPKARELVIIAVLCALSIAGRAAFFMLPQFKPVLAMTIIAGVAFGGETGFLVGAVTMLVSNILFSQGPWTPWQMFAMGTIGFFAGILYRKGLLRRTKASLCIFGVLSAILIYGGIMNPASALLWGSESLNWKMIMSYYLTGFPMDVVHAAATAFFLLFLAEPMLEKLDRIKVKYGLVE